MRPRHHRQARRVVPPTLAALLVACGGAGSDGPPRDPADDPPGTVEPTAPESGSGLPEPVERRLERAIGLFNGDPIEVAAALVERFDAPAAGTVEIARTPVGSRYADGAAETVERRCPNGGAVRSTDELDPGGAVLERDVAFSDCRIGAFDVDGEARAVRAPVPAGRVPPPYTPATLPAAYQSLDLRFTDRRTGRATVLSGASASGSVPGSPDAAVLLTVNWKAVAAPLSVTGPEGTTLVRNLSTGTVWLAGDGGAAVRVRESGLDVALSGDGGDGLTGFSTREPFVRDASDEHFVAGALEVTGERFRYELDAANGDPGSFSLSVEEGGATTGYTVPWSSRFELDAFEPFTVDLGF